LREQVAAGAAGAASAMEVVPIVDKNATFTEWDTRITESKKFMVGSKSAFNSKTSRNLYIRLLINGFLALTEFKDVSFQELFNPINGYANFQTLLNMVPVPHDHEGFYINDAKKKHLTSPFLSSP
jgi:hypothetical protein